MIKDEKQYEYAQEWIEKFKGSIATYDQDKERKKNDPVGWQMNRDALQSHFNALEEEVEEYERLISWDRKEPIRIKVDSLIQLPSALIKARIAAKLTYKELASRLDIDEEKIKRYEETDYQYASFLELLEVSEVLAIELEMAAFAINFTELEYRKKIAEKWHHDSLKHQYCQ